MTRKAYAANPSGSGSFNRKEHTAGARMRLAALFCLFVCRLRNRLYTNLEIVTRAIATKSALVVSVTLLIAAITNGTS